MKILLGVDKLLYGYGASRITLEMAEYLYNHGYDIKILCGKCNVQTDVPIILCKYSNMRFESSIIDALKFIKKEKPHIFHSHSYPMHICGAISRSWDIKHLMHYHGVWNFDLCSTPKMFLSASRTQLSDLISSHLSNRVITISYFLRNELINKLKVDNSKISVVYNSIDLDKLNPNLSKNLIKEKYNIDKKDPLLLCVSTLAKQKGHDLLIDCMKNVVDVFPTSKLLLVGRTGAENRNYRNELEKKIRNDNLESNIIFCGFVDDIALPYYYNACDLFVWATQWEGFGLPFAEAMACGKPVIGFDRTVMPEIIKEDYNGYIIKNNDTIKMANKISYLLDHPDIMKQLGINSRLYAEKYFNFKRNMEQIERIYMDMTSK